MLRETKGKRLKLHCNCSIDCGVGDAVREISSVEKKRRIWRFFVKKFNCTVGVTNSNKHDVQQVTSSLERDSWHYR